MNPIFRRSSFFYVTSTITYLGVMGRYLVTRDWTAFEVIPLFMPIWLVSGMLASESDEQYAYLRTLPVADSRVVKAKFALILGSAAVQWTLMTGVAVARMDEGISGPSTVVYLAIVCGAGMLAASGCQIAVWRFGFAAVKTWAIAGIAASLALAVIHTANLKYHDGWPILSQTRMLEWLARGPWIASAVVFALTLVAFRGLVRVGVRIKAASEAHL